jgi:hypothetical protein
MNCNILPSWNYTKTYSKFNLSFIGIPQSLDGEEEYISGTVQTPISFPEHARSQVRPVPNLRTGILQVQDCPDTR